MGKAFFTLYCFVKVFHLSYSGGTNKLLRLFGSGCSEKGLEKVVSGRVSPDNYLDLVDTASPKAKKVIDSLSEDLINWIYDGLLNKNAPSSASPDKYQKLGAILTLSLSYSQDIQQQMYNKRGKPDISAWINSMKEMKNIHYDYTELVIPITLEQSYKQRKEIISEAEGTIYISGSTLKDAFSTDNANNDTSVIRTILSNTGLRTVNIFLLNYVYLDVKNVDGNEDGSAEIERSIINFLGKVKNHVGTPPQINIVLLSDLHIPFMLITDKAMLTRNTYIFDKARSYKGQYLVFNCENDEYKAAKAYYEHLLLHSYPVDLDSKKESEFAVKKAFSDNRIRRFVSLKKIHPAQLLNLTRETFLFQKNGTDQSTPEKRPHGSPKDMKSYITPDPMQSVLLRYLERTQRLFTEVVERHDKNGYVQIIPSTDLGMPNNVTRIAGGFLTGALYDWRCAVPLIPVDATVNTCTSSVFSLSGFDETISDSEFDALFTKLSISANQNGYALNFKSGNHFLTVARDEDGHYYLVMHSSAKECKESCFGLYPSDRVWYKPYIKTHISEDQERYFRYIRGDAAMKFVDYSDRFRDYNREIHAFIAETFAKLFSTSLTNDTRIIRHHYGMPTHNSVVIGTFPVDINSEDRIVPIFSDYGKDFCIFEMANEQAYTHRLIGTCTDITLVPHGWGQAVDGLQDISVSDVTDEAGRKLILHCEHTTLQREVDPKNRLAPSDKHVRNYSDITSFIKMPGQPRGRILHILHPVYCYCQRSFDSDAPVYKLKDREDD